MIINWDLAPEGTTNATINGGEPYWYKLEDGKVLCWGHKSKEWMPSFFLTVDEISETGLRLYAYGEQSELVMLREQRDALLAILVELVDIEGPQPGTAEWADKAMALIDKCEGNAHG
jgi:hypothetical protein